jgi:hypothetical protein
VWNNQDYNTSGRDELRVIPEDHWCPLETFIEWFHKRPDLQSNVLHTIPDFSTDSMDWCYFLATSSNCQIFSFTWDTIFQFSSAVTSTTMNSRHIWCSLHPEIKGTSKARTSAQQEFHNDLLQSHDHIVDALCERFVTEYNTKKHRKKESKRQKRILEGLLSIQSPHESYQTSSDEDQPIGLDAIYPENTALPTTSNPSTPDFNSDLPSVDHNSLPSHSSIPDITEPSSTPTSTT